MPERLVLRARRVIQHHQRHGADQWLRARAEADRRGSRGPARPGARLGAALHADASGRLAERAARRQSGAARSARIFEENALSQEGGERARLWPVAMSARVAIWTDGACSGNPGPGGWGAILCYGEHEKELRGGEALTTNNRMELLAAISA